MPWCCVLCGPGAMASEQPHMHACGCKRLAAAAARARLQLQKKKHRKREGGRPAKTTAAAGGEIGGYRRHGRRWAMPNRHWRVVQAAGGAGWPSWGAWGQACVTGRHLCMTLLHSPLSNLNVTRSCHTDLKLTRFCVKCQSLVRIQRWQGNFLIQD